METIKSNTDISLVFAQGKHTSCATISLIAKKNPCQHDHAGRVAFVAGKKNGGAVWRNQAKRRMRAIVRDLEGPWDGYDMVFIAKKATTEQRYSKVLQQTQQLVAAVLENDGTE